MKQEEKRMIFTGCIVIALIFIFIIFVYTGFRFFGSGKVKCIEWDNYLHQEKMIFNCYDFINFTTRCTWQVDETSQELYVFPKNETTGGFSIDDKQTHYCTKYIYVYEVNNEGG